MYQIIEELERIVTENPKLTYTLTGGFNQKIVIINQGFKTIRTYRLTNSASIQDCREKLERFSYTNG